MKKLLFILLFIVKIFASNEAILKLDTKGHTALIRDIIVTKSGDIISASDDKTIRVWDSGTGLEKRKILGQIGAGSEGMIFAIALSEDETYLAVGGFILGSGNNGSRAGTIRIYNYRTGKLIKLLKSHTNVINDLAFSQNSRYLISGSADTTAKIWQIDNKTKDSFRLIDTIKFHTKQVYAVKIIKSHSRYFAVTAGYDNQIALYDMVKKKIVNSHKLPYKLQYLAINPKHHHIAVCGYGKTKEIKIYDYNLNLIKTIQSKTKPTGLHYSPNGKFLIAGSGAYPFNINIYKTSNYTLYSSFKKHTNLTMAVNFLDNSTVISGGGNNNEIYIWDIKTTKVKRKIEGVGQIIWSVGVDGDKIAWGNVWTRDSHTIGSKLQKYINLKDFQINSSSTTINSQFKRISTTNGRYSLSHSRGGDYGISDAVLNIKKDGKIVAKIVKNSYNGLGHNCYGWYQKDGNDFIISGGSNGHLKIYDKSGREIASLVGHTGTIWSIALDTKNDRLVSGGDDQTMMVWDLSKINKSSKIFPTLSIFTTKDNEYIAYTKEGFFVSSKKASSYIGYHINQGVGKEARYVTVDKLYNAFYRPDLIAKALKGKSLEKYAKNININKLLNDGFAPELKIVTKSFKSKKRDITLNLQVCEIDGGGYDNLTLYLNDMAIDVISNDRALKVKKQNRRRKECFNIEKLISLQNGKNKIGFKATNKAGTIESNYDTISIDYKGRSDNKPNLYILSIGVDKYRDRALWLTYSKADAKGFEKSIKNVSKSLFRDIYTYRLFDKDVTKNNILDIFEKIGKKTTREDVFILYMAGHGKTDDKTGAYYYIPVDFRYKNESSVREKGLSQRYFKLALSKIKAMKSLVILDTCNSGSFVKSSMASRGMLEKTAINKLTRATGRATLVASSGDQVALEGYKGHGVFTYTLIQALEGKGYGRDNKITIKELASYVEDVLPDITYEKWGYEQIPQSNISGNDFPIGIK